MNKTDIEWVYGPDGTQGYTWNPSVGCSPASEGCDNCYAARIANRFKGTKAFPDGFHVTLRPERINEPYKLKKPSRIFVCSMSDIFHPDVPDGFIETVFRVMRDLPQHTFFVLTKRPERMVGKDWCVCTESRPIDTEHASMWYAPNIWVGVSVENQTRANERIPQLMAINTAHRFISVEPMIGPVNLKPWIPNFTTHFEDVGDPPDGVFVDVAHWNRIDWVICGAESGPSKRPCKTEWVCKPWHQCKVANVPFFFKNYNDIRDANCAFDGEWPCPHDREWPKGP